MSDIDSFIIRQRLSAGSSVRQGSNGNWGCYPQQAVPAGAHLRTADEIHKLFGTQGVTMYGYNMGYQDYVAYYAPDGTLHARRNTAEDRGTWRITPDGKFCTMYNWIRGGVEFCRLVYDVGHAIYTTWNGALETITTKIVPGNPEHL